jgi:hypothetical protein
MRRSLRSVLLGAGLAISGCDHSADIAADPQPNESRPGELKPGDLDYPIENPTATHIIQFIAIVPPTLSLRFWYGYRAAVEQEDTDVGDTACQRQTGPETSVPVYVALPMQLIETGDSYRGTVVVDRFAPGGCNWAFAGISVLSENPPSHGTLLAGIYQDDGATAADYHIDEWCTRAPAFDPQRPEICLSLNALQRLKLGISSDFIKTVPLTERDDGRAVHVGPNTRTITVRFHDLDAELQSRGARGPSYNQ